MEEQRYRPMSDTTRDGLILTTVRLAHLAAANSMVLVNEIVERMPEAERAVARTKLDADADMIFKVLTPALEQLIAQANKEMIAP